MKLRWLFFLISAVVILPGIWSLLRFGVKPSIDFTGGSLIEAMIIVPGGTQPRSAQVQSVLSPDQIAIVQQTDGSRYLLRGKPMGTEQKDAIVAQLTTTFGPTSLIRFESVGPTLGKELLTKMITAGVIVLVVIILYIWMQFHDVAFGLAAVLAMVHDGLVLLGTFSLFGWWWGVEVDVLFVTALLTVLSFSIHDTIVVFDRIREMTRLHPRSSLEEIANAAVWQTMARSLNNSVTVILMLLCLVLLGGASIHWFAVALLLGAITGTYSSTFTAVPLLVTWSQQRRRLG